MQIFISGGCKNGKSTHAQRIAQRQCTGANPLYYIATMSASDHEDVARIARHQSEREGWGFTTLEQPRTIENILEKCDPNGSFLLDSLTALLANEMFSLSGDVDDHACTRISTGLTRILHEIRDIVIVSDYLYSDAQIYDPLTERYRKSLATLDRLVAKHCAVVLEATYTQLTFHKGGDYAIN
jgi:adenosylcobinamide kinase/adenosylcobinamide-phosphate guanylyltransferase